ncbi:hypothetical protein U9M48_041052 [Paspalum notatum var. saurae]|uniref:Uncharacterized protein n=1 Tax=Paspalum notatum var. saurae TaxID=547442 RepID=A0AAQ3XG57_PASNO
MGHLTGATPAPAMEVVDGKVDDKDRKVLNPVYDDWYATDQQVLGFLISSLSREIEVQSPQSQQRPRHGLRLKQCLHRRQEDVR